MVVQRVIGFESCDGRLVGSVPLHVLPGAAQQIRQVRNGIVDQRIVRFPILELVKGSRRSERGEEIQIVRAIHDDLASKLGNRFLLVVDVLLNFFQKESETSLGRPSETMYCCRIP